MTLLSNAFVATPSTTNNGSVGSGHQPSSITYSTWTQSATSSGSTQTPSQVLAMTIRKKRKLLRRRERNLRVEILLTSTIRRLCQDIGDHLRERRLASSKRKAPECDASSTPTVSYCSAKRGHFEEHADEAVKEEEGLSHACDRACESVSSDEPVAKNHSIDAPISNGCGSQLKRKDEFDEDSLAHERVVDSSSLEDTFNEKDPFGLDDFFRSLKTCRVGGSKHDS